MTTGAYDAQDGTEHDMQIASSREGTNVEMSPGTPAYPLSSKSL